MGTIPCPSHLSTRISPTFPEGSFPSHPTSLWGSFPVHPHLCHGIIPSPYPLSQETIPYPSHLLAGILLCASQAIILYPRDHSQPFPPFPRDQPHPTPSYPEAPFPPFPGPSVDPLVILQLPLEFFLLLLEPLLHFPLPSRCIHRLGPPKDGSSPAGLGSRSCRSFLFLGGTPGLQVELRPLGGTWEGARRSQWALISYSLSHPTIPKGSSPSPAHLCPHGGNHPGRNHPGNSTDPSGHPAGHNDRHSHGSRRPGGSRFQRLSGRCLFGNRSLGRKWSRLRVTGDNAAQSHSDRSLGIWGIPS